MRIQTRTLGCARSAALWLLILPLSAGFPSALLSGCSGGGNGFEIAEQPYTGPEIALDSSGEQHQIVLTAPTGGWEFRLDRTLDALGAKEVFVSAVRPNPAYTHTQALTEHRVGTSVPTSTAVRLYARILDHDQDPGSVEYRPAGAAPGSGDR